MNIGAETVFIFAGEKSGDLHGSKLAKALQELSPNIAIEGVAGPDMRSAGISGPLVMEDFEVMGLTDVLSSLPKLYSHFKTIRDHILTRSPSLVVLIDYPGFNLRLAKSLRKSGYIGKIVQYISPTVWAHGKHRIGQMEASLDLLLTIYPFEKKYFANSSLHVDYIGNPLCEYIDEYPYDSDWKYKIGVPLNSFLVALFPGSRKNEIIRNFPLIIATAEKILQNSPSTVFGLSIANETALDIISSYLSKSSKEIQAAVYLVPKKYTYELMKESRAAIAKSGTVTLELALHGCPTVVLYQLTFLNRLYAKYLLKLKLKNYCIVNILAGKEIFPELISTDPTVDILYESFKSIDIDGPARNLCVGTCKQLMQELSGRTPPSKTAAIAILALVREEQLVC